MKKGLVFLMVFFLSELKLFAQEETSNAYFETQAGVVKYSYFTNGAPAAQLGLTTPINNHLAMGVFAGGYNSIATSEKRDFAGRKFTYSPSGIRAGLLFRASTRADMSHFYMEVLGTVGKAFDTGASSEKEYSNAEEYLVGANIGINFMLDKQNFWGLFFGLARGTFDLDYGDNPEVGRLHFGLNYQKRL